MICSSKLYCNQICGKKLECGHTCKLKCHPGKCMKCRLTHIIKCNCGNESKEVSCEIMSYQCDRICDKMLECGNHKCGLKCHKGECRKCENYKKRSCPCGKTCIIILLIVYENLSCLENPPVCGDTCDKLLSCGIHHCTRLCHYGECDKCFALIEKSCLCGKSVKQLPCYEEYRCNSRCNEMKNCGRHKCATKCCNKTNHICNLICDRILSCGHHKCKLPCHNGPCPKCEEYFTLSCDCGYTIVKLQCDLQGKVDPPRCIMRCRKESLCHHKEIQFHLCHKGACPQCNLPCKLKLNNCEHECPLQCHDAIIVDPEKSQDLKDYLERDVIKYIKKPCPKCEVIVKRSCVGKHIVYFIFI